MTSTEGVRMGIELRDVLVVCAPSNKSGDVIQIRITDGPTAYSCECEVTDYPPERREEVIAILQRSGVNTAPWAVPRFTLQAPNTYVAAYKVGDVFVELRPDYYAFWFYRLVSPSREEELYFHQLRPGGPLQFYPFLMSEQQTDATAQTIADRLMATGLCTSVEWRRKHPKRYIRIVLKPGAAADPIASMTALATACPTEAELG